MRKRRWVDIWLREDELREIRSAARIQGISVDDYIRQVVRAARLAAEAAGEWPRKRGPARYSFPADSLDKMLAQSERRQVNGVARRPARRAPRTSPT